MQDQTNNRSRKVWRILLPIIMAFAIALSFIGGYFSHYLFENGKTSTVRDIIKIIENFGYVVDPETGELKDLKGSDYADALVSGLLDRYSEYYDAEEYAEVVEQSKGNHVGVGIASYSNHNSIFKVVGNSPAERAGLKAGDIIVAGQSEGVAKCNFSTGKDINDFVGSCQVGKEITFFVTRDGEFIEREFILKREKYTASYISYSDSEKRYVFRDGQDGNLVGTELSGGLSMLDDDSAYIKFDQFEGDAANQLKSALTYMRERGRTKLILDLRNNGGGYMSVLTKIASYLIYNQANKDTLIAVSSAKNGGDEFWARENNFDTDITTISVIANENTASASECLIGAMLHYGDRFSIDNLVIEKNSLGVAKTYGKGIMQTTYLLVTGGAFKLTTARILWPDRTTCIHEKGIIVDGLNATDVGESALIRASQILKSA